MARDVNRWPKHSFLLRGRQAEHPVGTARGGEVDGKTGMTLLSYPGFQVKLKV
jgi:hypothetical protein